MLSVVTGGAGFIGSHLSEHLAKTGREVRVLDNFKSGKIENLRWAENYRNVNIIRGDCTNPDDLEETLEGAEEVYHLAANPEVRLELNDPSECYRQNVYATFLLLESIRSRPIKKIAFTSSSTVYGDANQKPTPEDYFPLDPISVYGGSKLACEAMFTSYCNMFGKTGVIFRPANVVGPRSTHGVLLDFARRLRENPRELAIFGDGTQEKSYIHIDDCVKAITLATGEATGGVETYNLGSRDQINVKRIAELLIDSMGLQDVKTKFLQTTEGGRGWPGDVKSMWLDMTKMEELGFLPKWNSAEAISLTIRSLVNATPLEEPIPRV